MARVLIVDDDQIIRHICMEYLSQLGHLGDVAEDGVGAIEKLNAQSFDLVISDLAMPNKGGLELIHELRSANSECRIVAMTAGSRGSYAYYQDSAERSGIDGFLKKPFSYMDFEVVVNQALSTLESGE